ncbi:MAG TPA: hypothetical protein DDW50_01130 [Firmicutes bacterium]|jgi:LAS superfamily LD-carboxypeptidase LdcB|nr:hypothetical protein [Bacillota bacterium]
MSAYVVTGATLKCNQGDQTSNFQAASGRTVYINNKAQANIMDAVPNKNIMPFGQCKSMSNPTVAAATAANEGRLQKMPCVPVIIPPWKGGKTNVLIQGKAALVEQSTILCQWCGQIKIQKGGQSSKFAKDGAVAAKQPDASSSKSQQTEKKATNKAIKYISVETPGGGRLVDKTEAIAKNLVTLQGADGKYQIDYRAAIALKDMLAQARKEGYSSPLLLLYSGYRNDKKQGEMYNAEVSKIMKQERIGEEAAKKEASDYVAPPGGPHRTGRAIDLKISVTYTNCKGNIWNLKHEVLFKWLCDNAQNYGFYNYPKEPWHWEYNPPAPGIYEK